MIKDRFINEKIAIAYTLDNMDQFIFLKRSISALLSSNREKKNFNIYLFQNNIATKDIQCFLQLIENRFHFKITVVNINSFFNEFLSKLKLVETMLFNVILPFFLNEKYLVFLDCDTLPNIDIFTFMKNNKHLLYDKILLRNNQKLLPNTAARVFSEALKNNVIEIQGKKINQKYLNLIEEEYGNGGVTIIKIKNYKKYFKNKKACLFNSVNEYITNCEKLEFPFTDKTHYYSDEAFYSLYLNGKISTKLSTKYNLQLYNRFEDLLHIIENNPNDHIMHFVLRPKYLREKIYKKFENELKQRDNISNVLTDFSTKNS